MKKQADDTSYNTLEIKYKYCVGQELWYLNFDRRAEKKAVNYISFDVELRLLRPNVRARYGLCGDVRCEADVFETKQELLDSL